MYIPAVEENMKHIHTIKCWNGVRVMYRVQMWLIDMSCLCSFSFLCPECCFKQVWSTIQLFNQVHASRWLLGNGHGLFPLVFVWLLGCALIMSLHMGTSEAGHLSCSLSWQIGASWKFTGMQAGWEGRDSALAVPSVESTFPPDLWIDNSALPATLSKIDPSLCPGFSFSLRVLSSECTPLCAIIS